MNCEDIGELFCLMAKDRNLQCVLGDFKILILGPSNPKLGQKAIEIDYILMKNNYPNIKIYLFYFKDYTNCDIDHCDTLSLADPCSIQQIEHWLDKLSNKSLNKEKIYKL